MRSWMDTHDFAARLPDKKGGTVANVMGGRSDDHSSASQQQFAVIDITPLASGTARSCGASWSATAYGGWSTIGLLRKAWSVWPRPPHVSRTLPSLRRLTQGFGTPEWLADHG